MTKRLLILLAICSLSLASLNGCTSKESKDDSEVATDAPAAAGGDNLEAVDGSATPPVAGTTADALPEDSLESALSETPPTAEAPAPSAPSSSDLKAVEPTLDMPSDEPSLGAPSSSGIADIEPPAKESKPKAETVSSEAPAPAAASLQKVPDVPFQQSGILLNTVYIARPGDTVSSVSQMIYGSDKTTELKKANPKLKNRDPRPSEKIFYNSPVRSTDSEKMMTYYEDNGMKAETYVAQEGDTIQKVGKNLLGYDKGWKEIWTTNAIESKGKLEAGTEIKYYKGAAAKIASNESAPAAKEELPPPPASMGEASALPPPPPPDMAANNQPPPPNDMNGLPPPPPPAMNDLPPPPPPEAAAPPPPPPPPAAPVEKKMPAVAKAGESMDEETMFALGGIAVAALGLTAILVAKRKRRQKELEAAFNETQVGT